MADDLNKTMLITTSGTTKVSVDDAPELDEEESKKAKVKDDGRFEEWKPTMVYHVKVKIPRESGVEKWTFSKLLTEKEAIKDVNKYEALGLTVDVIRCRAAMKNEPWCCVHLIGR